MTDTNSLYEKINEGGNMDEVRNEITSLINEALNTFGESINNWQKTFISRAVRKFSL